MNELRALESLKQQKELSVNEMRLIQTIILSVTDSMQLIFGTSSWVGIDDADGHKMCSLINDIWLNLDDRIKEAESND